MFYKYFLWPKFAQTFVLIFLYFYETKAWLLYILYLYSMFFKQLVITNVSDVF